MYALKLEQIKSACLRRNEREIEIAEYDTPQIDWANVLKVVETELGASGERLRECINEENFSRVLRERLLAAVPGLARLSQV